MSLTHVEGFGRPLLEATMTGLPVMASNWSGQCDFLDSNLSVMLPGKLNNVHPSSVWDKVILKESQWFTVDYSYASRTLMDIWKNFKNYKSRALKQGSNNRLKFTLSNMKKEFTELVDKYIPEFPKQVDLKLPKLKKVGGNKSKELKLPKLKKTTSEVQNEPSTTTV